MADHNHVTPELLRQYAKCKPENSLWPHEILTQAADCIEELNQKRNEYKRQADGYYHEAADALEQVKRLREGRVEYVCGHFADLKTLRTTCPVCERIAYEELGSEIERLREALEEANEMARNASNHVAVCKVIHMVLSKALESK